MKKAVHQKKKNVADDFRIFPQDQPVLTVSISSDQAFIYRLYESDLIAWSDCSLFINHVGWICF